MSTDIKITEGGPNVFADLGLPNAEELLVKSQLALQIAHAAGTLPCRLYHQSATKARRIQIRSDRSVSSLFRGYSVYRFGVARGSAPVHVSHGEQPFRVQQHLQDEARRRTTLARDRKGVTFSPEEADRTS